METNLSCDELKLMISAYFDNELSQEESLYIENHLQQCETCSLEVENIKKLSQILKSYDAKINISQAKTVSFVLNRLKIEDSVSCNEVLDELSAYYDGELNLKLHYLIKDHLTVCNNCRRDYDNLKFTQSLIHGYFENLSGSSELTSRSICKKVLKRLELQGRRKVFLTSIAVSVVMSILVWFSITGVEPNILKSTYANQSELEVPAEPMYVKSENLVFAKNYSTPPEGVLAVLYDND